MASINTLPPIQKLPLLSHEVTRAFELKVELIEELGIVFATDEEKEKKQVILHLTSPEADKGYMLRFEQFESRQPIETRGERIEIFNGILSHTGNLAGLKPFNQIPDSGDHRMSGWEFWVDKNTKQAEIIEYALKVAEVMNMDLILDED